MSTAGALSGAAQGASAGMVAGPWGAAIGGVVGGAIGFFSGDQSAAPAAPLEKVDYAKSINDTIAANQQALVAGQSLSTDTNSFNQKEALRLMEIAVPGYGAMQQELYNQGMSDLKNQYNLPPEVEANLARKAAEKGVTRGTSGNFNEFSLLRDLGVNMLDYANASRVKALNTLSTMVGQAPRVSPMSPMQMFLTPQNVIDTTMKQNIMNQEIAQGTFNAQTAADNYNKQLLADSAGLLGGAAADIFNKAKAPKNQTAPSTDGPFQNAIQPLQFGLANETRANP